MNTIQWSVLLTLIVLGAGVFLVFVGFFSPIPPVCSEKWVCSEWSTCESGMQSRACVDSNECGTALQKPIVGQPCSCVENWSCTNWSACTNNKQTRTCADLNACNTTNNKPLELQSCTSEDTSSPVFIHFYAQAGNAKNMVYFSASDETPPIRYTLLRSTNRSILQNVQAEGSTNSFDNPPSNVMRVFEGTNTIFNDRGLTNGTAYYYRIRACDNANPPNCVALSATPNGIPSPSASDTTPPSIDTFSLSEGDTNIVVEYLATESGSVTSLPVKYTLVRANSSTTLDNLIIGNFQNGGSGIIILVNDSTQTIPYHDLGLTNGTNYFYRLQACDSANPENCSGSTSIQATPSTQDITSPSPPNGLTSTTLSSTSIHLAWAASTDNVGVTGYRIDVSTSPLFSTFVMGWNNNNVGNTLTTNVTGLNASTTYYARARAYDAAGNTSTNSNTASATTNSGGDTTPPNVQFSVSKGNQKAVITFSATDATLPITYTLIISRNATAINSPTLNFDSLPSSMAYVDNPSTISIHNIPLTWNVPFDDSPLVNGQTYYYRLRACDNATPKNCFQTTPALSVTPEGPTVTMSFGPTQTVFDYSTQACNKTPGNWDFPDIFAHAVRNPLNNNQIVFSAGNSPRNYFMYGPDFDHLTRNCVRPVLTDTQDPNPDSFNNLEWITSLYAENGIIYGLIDNEFHDATNPSICGSNSPSACWYNGVTQITSTDGGRTFSPDVSPVVSAPPLTWNASTMGQTPYGYLTPSNIVKRSNGYYYSVFPAHTGVGVSHAGTCLMRTDNLSDPTSWRAWDGSGFTITMQNPYTNAGQTPCTFLNTPLFGSLTENTYLDSFGLGPYMLVGDGKLDNPSTPTYDLTCGFWYALSNDLITWTTPNLIQTETLTYCTGGQTYPGPAAYASLIDHSSTDPNFQTAGSQPYLYWTYFNASLDRDLVRHQLTITVTP